MGKSVIQEMEQPELKTFRPEQSSHNCLPPKLLDFTPTELHIFLTLQGQSVVQEQLSFPETELDIDSQTTIKARLAQAAIACQNPISRRYNY